MSYPTHPGELNSYLNQEVSSGRMSLETSRSIWAENTRRVDDAWNRKLEADRKDWEIKKARYEQAQQERIRDEAYKNRLTESDRQRIAQEDAAS
jgi:hypothetical protein